MKPFFEARSIRIYDADILEIDAVEEDSVDLVVTSPAYDVDIKYENHNEQLQYDRYLEFARKWLSKVRRLAKPDGRLCLNIPLDKSNGGQQSVTADITRIAKEVGWKYHSTIIWNEQNTSGRTAWDSSINVSAPFVTAPVETIVLLYKNKWEKAHKGKSDITRDEFMEWTNGVWNLSGESRTRIGHSAPFPIELPKRCIKLFSFRRDVVLDPFLGSGTTLIACVQTDRIGIGVDINRNYCELAKRRLVEEELYQRKLEEALQSALETKG
jgi:site-specific DNA-methyltransferase (adenine-specific)